MMLSTAETTAACLAEHASRGPRYTSYPPATEFGPIAAEQIEAELERLTAAATPVSLYVHIPFCKSLCAYCGCNVIPTRDETRGIGYVDQLATEMTVLARTLRAPVTEIALGGGSPNFLAPRTLRTLVGSLDRYFSVATGARRSVELDPRTTSSSQIETLADLGFTSVSVGVQDFAEPVQDAIRRHQSVVQTRWLVSQARAFDFDDVNIDMVYGLPRQTETSFAATLDSVIELAPDRIALFGYAHLPSKLPHQRIVEKAGRVLDGYERATLLVMAIEKLTGAGYVHVGLDHFARPTSSLARAAAEKRMTRSFQGYVERRADAVVGLGTSSISSTPRMHWQNHTTLPRWEEAIAAQQLPVQRGFVLDSDDQVRRALIMKLMCDGTVDLEAIGRAHGIDAASYFARELAAVGSLPELATHDASTSSITTTPIGKLLVRNVCMVFDRYHRSDLVEPRYSPTI